MNMNIAFSRIAAVIVFFALVGGSIAQSAPESIIEGQVINPDGLGVPFARIVIFPMEQAVSGPLPTTTTDSKGRFVLTTPPFGKTRFCAVKESDGYPNTQLLLFSSGKETMPEVELAAGTRLHLDIHLGEPDGVLHLSVVDASTGLPASHVRVTLRRHDPDAFFSTSLGENGKLELALPPVPIELSIASAGYQTIGGDPRSILVRAAEQQDLKVEVKKQSSQAND